ncbi:DUF3037 domain-containing protein [Flavobacterium sp.]|jgi:hypothetical protein|uniref:DUF3037 domain-containing protein n=1 Tax=Flavobacterium sp. TaxID=239 RepID=UPI0022CAA594|nr:DUF3037 domain-containing protein [Flavobacterium sp.]MCZ8297682.1 DUF3037 domain-containing protein [Flavobacterium sp.]
MDTNFYTYCILKYKHSPYLDESVNIGVLIYFENTQRFVFKYSKTLNRIKSIYSTVPEKTIREYIRQISHYLTDFNSNKDFFNTIQEIGLKSFLSSNVLAHDSTVVQFCNYHTESLRGFSEDLIEQIVVDKVFIDDLKTNVNTPQEPKLLNHLYKALNNNGLSKYFTTERIQKDLNITTDTGNFTFDFAWKNGVWNLVKPVGFDLKTPEGIINKARANLGEFTDLDGAISTTEFKCNIIVGRPTEKGLFSSYDKALKILQKSPNTDIIEENEIPLYSEKIIKAVSKI